VSRVQSIERAFSVLSTLADGPLGVTEVADRARLPKSTAARMLASLVREGAVEQAAGLVVLASLPRLDAYLAKPLEPFTDRTIVAPDALQSRVADVRRDGYAWVREEFAPGINSVAAPIADATGEIVAAVHVHGPSYRFPPPDEMGAADRLGELVEATAGRIGTRLRG
jgi:DNA-binding IclR family transcriptional regulator